MDTEVWDQCFRFVVLISKFEILMQNRGANLCHQKVWAPEPSTKFWKIIHDYKICVENDKMKTFLLNRYKEQ